MVCLVAWSLRSAHRAASRRIAKARLASWSSKLPVVIRHDRSCPSTEDGHFIPPSRYPGGRSWMSGPGGSRDTASTRPGRRARQQAPRRRRVGLERKATRGPAVAPGDIWLRPAAFRRRRGRLPQRACPRQQQSSLLSPRHDPAAGAHARRSRAAAVRGDGTGSPGAVVAVRERPLRAGLDHLLPGSSHGPLARGLPLPAKIDVRAQESDHVGQFIEDDHRS